MRKGGNNRVEGSKARIGGEEVDKSMSGIKEEWEIQFSRFFNSPPNSSASSSVTIHPDLTRRRNGRKGIWISSSSAAYLQLLIHHNSSQAVLIIHSGGRIHEEHFISKLHFSWPHVSCVSGFPARGSRVVFVSYKDCVSQVQKFAFRFSTIYEAERFTDALKEILKDVQLPSSGIVTEVSSQTEFISSNIPPYRASGVLTIPIHSHSSLKQPSLNYEVVQHLNSQETSVNHKYEGNFMDLPPSFTSLLTNCCSEAQAAAQPTVHEEMNLRSQITRYMEDSSFQDMLFKVEKVISEMEADLVL